jgi:hypothetical protein
MCMKIGSGWTETRTSVSPCLARTLPAAGGAVPVAVALGDGLAARATSHHGRGRGRV